MERFLVALTEQHALIAQRDQQQGRAQMGEQVLAAGGGPRRHDASEADDENDRGCSHGEENIPIRPG